MSQVIMQFTRSIPSLILIYCLLSVLACSGPSRTLKKQDLFSLSLGVMEDEIDFFERDGTLFFDRKIDIFMRDGLFFVTNPTLGKVMKFSSYGDILSLIYNERYNLPFKTNDQIYRVSTWGFQNIGHLTVDSQGNLYVDDRIEVDAESLGMVTTDRVILKFNSNGEYEGFLGQEGKNGIPLSYILGLETTKDDALVAVTRSEKSWNIYIYEKDQSLRFDPIEIATSIPSPDGNADLVFQINAIKADRNARYLYLSASGIVAGVSEILPRMLIYNIEKRRFEGNFLFPLAKQGKEFEFLGCDNEDQLYFVRDISKTGAHLAYELQILNTQGVMLESILLASDLKEPTISTNIKVSADGIVYALLTYGFGLDTIWWRHK
ncbi:MAG: LIC_12708 family protein [Spirochaetia bacterium]